MAVDIETRRADLFPAALLAGGAAARRRPRRRRSSGINRYLATGGTILFDTRDGDEQHRAVLAAPRSQAQRLRRLAAGLNIPPLVPVPPDHVLTKSFYLMQEFPGRWAGGTLWVEPAEDQVNDGVSSVIVGGNDWAGAWAVDKARPAALCPSCRAASRSARWRSASASTS